MAFFGNDEGEIMTTKQAAKLGKVYQFQNRWETDSQTLSKAEQARLHELDMQEYMRVLDKAADNLIMASKPKSENDTIDLYTERTRKKKFIEVNADCAKDGNYKTLNLYAERVNK